ncbi:MAG: TetR/AcrR family transcriptional regulator [Bacteroidetes bacterium]|nr:TetR/AcrR family transcriptional regulator [Bacteroidota bacterium]
MPNKVKILTAVSELFTKYGVKAITMDDIAKHLSMSKKTIYQFFKDKDDVVISLVKLKISENKTLIEASVAKSKNIVEEMFGTMECMRIIFSRINPVFFYEISKYFPNAWVLFVEFKNGFILNSLKESLKKGQEEGYVRNDINIELLSMLRIEMLELAMKGELFYNEKFNLLDAQLQITEHFLHGVCTLKGHKLINKYKNINEN